ncbi:MAG TPA: hypothetical protein VHL10_07110, partial [Nitrososphaera sp.]|nr:hypothetical protein [Nitrososphaera sp.]
MWLDLELPCPLNVIVGVESIRLGKRKLTSYTNTVQGVLARAIICKLTSDPGLRDSRRVLCIDMELRPKVSLRVMRLVKVARGCRGVGRKKGVAVCSGQEGVHGGQDSLVQACGLITNKDYCFRMATLEGFDGLRRVHVLPLANARSTENGEASFGVEAR